MSDHGFFHKLMDAIYSTFTHHETAKALDKKAAEHHPKLNWRSSVIDLMELTGYDSSLESRVQMAKELDYHGVLDGSAAMNDFLHKKVLERLGIETEHKNK